MELYRNKNINKTNKHHKCHLCDLDIPKGSNCLYEAGKYDGEFFSRYSHNECHIYWQDLNSDTYSEDEWVQFRDMAEVYPHTSFQDWQRIIGAIYSVLGGGGL